MSLDYIRKTYKVPAYEGVRVSMETRKGVIVGAEGPHVKVKFDDRRGHYPVHPIELTYHVEPVPEEHAPEHRPACHADVETNTWRCIPACPMWVAPPVLEEPVFEPYQDVKRCKSCGFVVEKSKPDAHPCRPQEHDPKCTFHVTLGGAPVTGCVPHCPVKNEPKETKSNG